MMNTKRLTTTLLAIFLGMYVTAQNVLESKSGTDQNQSDVKKNPSELNKNNKGIKAKTKGSIEGRIVDGQNMPVAFANVVLLAPTDSAYVAGTTSGTDGKYRMAVNRQDGLLRISAIGYTTQYAVWSGTSPIDITLQAAEQTLGEAVVAAQRPTYKLTSEGLLTNVENTLLSKLGTAEDVLRRIPGLTQKDKQIEVFGMGTPMIYINGRRMRDASELDQIKSEDIKSVEVITHPGAKYDASVRAVIKIKTKAAQGEGFGFDARSSYYQSENTDLIEQFNWNYRRRRFDLFGTLYYASMRNHNWSTTETTVEADTLWHQLFTQDYKRHGQNFRNTIGANYALNDSNSVGVRYLLRLCPTDLSHGRLSSDITANGAYYDHLDNRFYDEDHSLPYHLLNAYYKGKAGKTEIDFNMDYLFFRETDDTRYTEESESKEDRVVNTGNKVRNRLFAAKLVVDHPLWGGNASIGTEYSHTQRNDDFYNPEGYVPTSDSELREKHWAAFLEYSHVEPYLIL